MDENNIEVKTQKSQANTAPNGSQQIAGAIILAGLIIAGAVLIKGGSPTSVGPNGKKLLTSAKVFNKCLDSDKYAQAVADSKTAGASAGVNGTPKGFILADGKVVFTIDGAEPSVTVKQKIEDALSGKGIVKENIKLDPVSNSDFVRGKSEAKVTVIEYADFQCPFCGRFFKDTEKMIDSYVDSGKINFVYRDFAFLGPESDQAAEAARCAGEQGKFWEYHDYLYTHQNGENQGNFGDPYLKSFAGELKLK